MSFIDLKKNEMSKIGKMTKAADKPKFKAHLIKEQYRIYER